MLRINCPWCGCRDEDEFDWGGEAHVIRPETPSDLTDEQWADYLFNNANTKGVQLERWRHTFGCRQWFNLARDTVTHDILETYLMGEQSKSYPKEVASTKEIEQQVTL